jgi:hypothetical protein
MLLVEGEADFEFLVAVVHEVLEDDRGGDNQRADDERHGVMKEEIADCKDEHRDNNSERIGLDYDYQAEYGGYYSHSEHYEAVRNQREQNAVGCGDRLAALEFEYGRERVTEHGRRYNERKEHIFEVGDIELCKKYRSEAFCDIKQEAEHAELDADAAHNIGHAGIVILALFDDIDSTEQLWNKVAVHDASRNITCKSEKQIFQYTIFHSLHLSLDICENKQKPFSRSTLLL